MPFTITELAAEVDADPIGRGYSGMSDAQVADSLNAEDRTVEREFLETWEMQSAVVGSEFGSLPAAARDAWLAIVGLGRVPIRNANLRAQVGAIWGPGTTTRANLVTLQTRTGSRAEELWGDGERVDHAQVAQARRL